MTNVYARKLSSILNEFNDKVEALADEYRKNVLVPLCKKRQICFISGNGTFYFYPADEDGLIGASWTVSDDDEAAEHRKKYLLPYLETLNEEVSVGQYFGYWVGDVRPADLK